MDPVFDSLVLFRHAMTSCFPDTRRSALCRMAASTSSTTFEAPVLSHADGIGG